MSTVPGAIILTRSNPAMIRPSVRSGQATFFWGSPASDGGEPITGYTLIDSGNSITCNYSPSTFSATVGGLTDGTPYTFSVYATNSVGNGAPATYRTIQPGNRPDVPQNVAITEYNSNTANVTWDAPVSDGGADIFWYVIKSDTNPALKFSASGAQSNKYITGLTQGNVYRFSVQAVNDPGYSLKVFTPNFSPGSVIQDGLLVWLSAPEYAGSGTWFDKTSNNFDATLENGTIAKNMDGNGIVLDGSTNYEFPFIGSHSTFTMSVWFKRTGNSDSGAAIVTQNFTSDTINMVIVGNELGFGDTEFAGGFYNNAWYIGAPQIFPLNEWVNMVITWDGTFINTYINDVFVNAALPFASSGSINANTYRIGRRWDLPSYVRGEIGEVLIYNRALTSGEISSNYSLSSNLFL
jgi:Concanavalin A-like lectin/glucanases superfamily/Fibronectin type III domain